jgi:hypothetical protein
MPQDEVAAYVDERIRAGFEEFERYLEQRQLEAQQAFFLMVQDGPVEVDGGKQW